MCDKPKDILDHLARLHPDTDMFHLPEGTIEALAEQAAREGWTPDEIIDAVRSAGLNIVDETNKPTA